MDLLTAAKRIGIEGFMHPSELEQLVDLAVGQDVLEVGSFKGLSAWAMATVANTLHCVDTFRANSAGQQQLVTLQTLEDFRHATKRFNNVTFFVGTSEDGAKQPGLGMFSLIFLDAMHTYEDVRDDIQRWWTHLISGGVMAFHDYRHRDFPGVEKAVDEIFGPAPGGTTVGSLRWLTKP